MNNKIILVIVSCILLFIIIFRQYLIKFVENYTIPSIPSTTPIDFVYTWVDQYDPEREYYQQLLLNKHDFNLDPSRYDQSDELKYSIRSIQQNCPWYKNIYIVVKDGQKPNFLNFDNERIILVNHSEIMPKTSLPTFSSLSIEACIHKIKNLSDFYIYMNDDFFITKPLNISDFIDEINHLPIINIIPGSKKYQDIQDIQDIQEKDTYDFGKMYDISMDMANKITSQNLKICPVHTPSICYKPWDIEFENILKNINTKYGQNLWDYTVHSKFRKNDNAAINGCMRPIFYNYKGSKKINYLNETKLIDLDKNNCDFDIPQNIKFLCVNKVNNTCKENFKKIISIKFNFKSPYET